MHSLLISALLLAQSFAIMFNGADVVFRNVLVPIAGQREALLLKDAKTLAKTMIKQLPASRHGEAGEAIAEAFLVEAKKQGV